MSDRSGKDHVIEKLEGTLIKEIFRRAKELAELHATLTSKRGDNFRRRLLESLSTFLALGDIETLRSEAHVRESGRHINKLLKFKLIERIKENQRDGYKRRESGEVVLNALRELERRIGKKEAIKVYEANLGLNAIKLFLRIYGRVEHKEDISLEIKYSFSEMGRLSMFLRRGIERTAAIEGLSDAELLLQKEGEFWCPPRKMNSFYRYLKALYGVVL